ncbi:hypothetical protein [Sphingomonas sp. ID0503]|uniref:hypothetical protein n=1 Tax=Sphingomonas sp. ID0503 TaxID=3399691 RepID=UPI003AFA371D
MTSLRTDGRTVRELLGGVDLSQPIGMLNLLKFRAEAQYDEPSSKERCSGADAYRRYAEGVMPLLAGKGITLHLRGGIELIGPPDEWDAAFVIRYPRGEMLVELAESAGYVSVVHHRAAAVADSRLLLMEFVAEEVTELLR